jgi:hypothetical protein
MKNILAKNQIIVEIKDLSFVEQVFIWGLRMKVRGDQYFAKVTAHCEKNLSPSAARIALNSINMVINSVRNHGTRSLILNCTCMPRLSADEWLLITLYRSANHDPMQTSIQDGADIITEEGNESLLHAILSFQMALGTMEISTSKSLNQGLVAQQLELAGPRPVSKMVH